MKILKLTDIDLTEIGNEIDLWGVVYQGKGRTLMIPLPDRSPLDLAGPAEILQMDREDMAKFLDQTDVLNVLGPRKAFIRKSQRRIDRIIQWEVFKRDGYRCRYCGQEAPLTVDHIILWENGGASIGANLLSACSPCNKKRGNTPYEEWIRSSEFSKVSRGLSQQAHLDLLSIIHELPRLERLKVNTRSR